FRPRPAGPVGVPDGFAATPADSWLTGGHLTRVARTGLPSTACDPATTAAAPAPAGTGWPCATATASRRSAPRPGPARTTVRSDPASAALRPDRAGAALRAPTAPPPAGRPAPCAA